MTAYDIQTISAAGVVDGCGKISKRKEDLEIDIICGDVGMAKHFSKKYGNKG